VRLPVKSLQLRLTLELTALFIVAGGLAVGGLVYSAMLTANSLSDRDLSLRAQDLAEHVVPIGVGAARLDLPPNLARSYEAAGQRSLYAIRDRNGALIATSLPEFGAASLRWPAESPEPTYFQLSKFGPTDQDYAGMSVQLNSPAGELSIAVAEISGGEQLVHAILADFIADVAWYIPPFAALVLLVAIYRVRRGLRPLQEASDRAGSINPESIGIRLPEADVPAEALPLVGAVNRALDRLEEGFLLQRRFTANAAHELRTPLTIITARLDTLEGNGPISALREEVARMNRLVEQLLCVARLDSVALDVSAELDLRQLSQDVVGSTAHRVLARGRTIALAGADCPVMVNGNAAAIEDALRNLVENALTHTPPGTEILVEVDPAGAVSVSDFGPGVPIDDRTQIFERFWRGKGSASGGAGLGLAIVMEIARAHGASARVDDRCPHGARFELRFRNRPCAHAANG
jgi:signal transduction histidine kinase